MKAKKKGSRKVVKYDVSLSVTRRGLSKSAAEEIKQEAKAKIPGARVTLRKR